MTIPADYSIRSNRSLIAYDQPVYLVRKNKTVVLHPLLVCPETTSHLSKLPKDILGIVTKFLKSDTLLERNNLDKRPFKDTLITWFNDFETIKNLPLRTKDYNETQRMLINYSNFLSAPSEADLREKVKLLQNSTHEKIFFSFKKKINFSTHKTKSLDDKLVLILTSFKLKGREGDHYLVFDHFSRAVRVSKGIPDINNSHHEYVPILNIYGCDYRALKTIVNIFRYHAENKLKQGLK